MATDFADIQWVFIIFAFFLWKEDSEYRSHTFKNERLAKENEFL
jgi:hypothetical protein